MTDGKLVGKYSRILSPPDAGGGEGGAETALRLVPQQCPEVL